MRMFFLLVTCLLCALGGIVVGAMHAGAVLDQVDRVARPFTGGTARLSSEPRALEFWAMIHRRETLEPVLDPRRIADAISVCVGTGEAFDTCIANRGQLPDNARRALSEPQAMRNIAYCLKTGCAGAMIRAPANACLWWTLYVEATRPQSSSMDERMRDEACASATFGSDRRRDELMRAFMRAAIERN